MLDELKQKLQAEVERLNHEINFVLPKEIEKARAHGDLRENSEYKAALERQQFVTSRLSHLRLRLRRDVTNCWRSSAALYSEFSRRSPCARAFSISFGSTKLIS